MRYLYVDTEEDIPPNSSEYWDQPVQMNVFVHYDHSVDRIMRRPQNLILL